MKLFVIGQHVIYDNKFNALIQKVHFDQDENHYDIVYIDINGDIRTKNTIEKKLSENFYFEKSTKPNNNSSFSFSSVPSTKPNNNCSFSFSSGPSTKPNNNSSFSSFNGSSGPWSFNGPSGPPINTCGPSMVINNYGPLPW